MERPATRYARSGEVHIAYQVAGDGPLDLVFVPGFVSNVDRWWQLPAPSFVERLAGFSRLLLFDKRGTGLSDPVPFDRMPTLEERMDDVRAVMDAAGFERAAVLGVSEGGAMAALFAATYPDRCQALVLLASTATFRRSEQSPWGWSPEFVESTVELMESSWGSGDIFASLAPAAARDPLVRRLLAEFERTAASPGAAAALVRLAAETDASGVLDAITVPTLVVHRTGDLVVRVEAGRELARRIPGARFAELGGSDHAPMGDAADIVAEIEEFLTGVRSSGESDRVLATVLFTDMVESTRTAVAQGDHAWRATLDAYESLVERQLDRFRGRRIKFTGDGTLATFDGPARAIRCASALAHGARQLGLEIRSGIHTGECEVRGDDVAGIAVVIASRVMAHADPGEILVSRTVCDLVAGSGLTFLGRGTRPLKGVPGDWPLFAAGS